MDEHETDPQRHEAPSTGEPSHQPADASHEGTSPQRGQSDPTAAHPTVGLPPTPPWQQQPQSPWQQPQQPGYGHQQYYAQQQNYPSYPGQQHPYTAQGGWTGPEPQGGWTGQEPQGGWTGQEPQGGWTGPESQGGWSGPDQQPAWAAPVDTRQREAAPSGRGRRVLITGALAVLLALGAGGVGAATALAFDDNDSSAVKTANSAVTRVVDRSSLAQIAAAVQDSVVSITTESGEGSGVILTADGSILTNNHVVATAQGNTVQVTFANGKKATATIAGTDPRTDLAVVKASGMSGLKAATLGDSSKMLVGDTVLAIGSPLGLEGSVTQGIISAKDRTIQSSSEQEQQGQQQTPFGGQQQQQQGSSTTMSGLLQTDAPINPGNSGGALVNTNGEVIGINSAIATSGSNSGNIGLGFAIPSNKARIVYEALATGKKVSHPALGVSVTEAQGGGALISAVTANSGASKAGIQEGDVIQSVDGKPINDSDDLVGVIQSANVGDKVTVVFTRDGAQKTVTATLTEAS